MRERNKTAQPKITSSAAIVQSDSIIERIGESSSGFGGSSQLPKNAVATQSLGRKKGKENVKMQNFFNIPRPERDNNSIINIML